MLYIIYKTLSLYPISIRKISPYYITAMHTISIPDHLSHIDKPVAPNPGSCGVLTPELTDTTFCPQNLSRLQRVIVLSDAPVRKDP